MLVCCLWLVAVLCCFCLLLVAFFPETPSVSFHSFSCVGMDNRYKWIDDRLSSERVRHRKKKKTLPEPACCGLRAHQEHAVDQDAHTAERKKVPAAVLQVAPHAVATDSDKDESITATTDYEESDSASESEQNELPSSLASDSEQYERMQAAYSAVGRDYKNKETFIGSEYHKLRRLEEVPQRWLLARLSIPLQ